MSWNPWKVVARAMPIRDIGQKIEKVTERANVLGSIGNMVERWNPLPSIKMPTIPGPTPEQLAAQAAQARLLNEQADQIKAGETAAEAARRARLARMAGRNSLLLDEVGIIDGTRPMQNALGA